MYNAAISIVRTFFATCDKESKKKEKKIKRKENISRREKKLVQ